MLAAAVLLTAVAITCSCGRVSDSRRLSRLESIVAEYPDSVFDDLTRMDSARLNGGSRNLYRIVRGEAECRLNIFEDSVAFPFLSTAEYYDLRQETGRAGKAHFLAALAFSGAGQPDNSILEYRKALNRFRQTDDTLWMAFTERGLAEEFQELGDSKSSLEYCTSAEKHFRSLGQESRAAYIKYRASISLNSLGRYRESLSFADDVMRKGEELGDSLLMGMCYAVKGYDYLYLDKPDSSVYCYGRQYDVSPESMSGQDYNYWGVAASANGGSQALIDTCRARAVRTGVNPMELDYSEAVKAYDLTRMRENLTKMVEDQGSELHALRGRTLTSALENYYRAEEDNLNEKVSSMRVSRAWIVVSFSIIVLLLVAIVVLERKFHLKKMEENRMAFSNLAENLKGYETRMEEMVRASAELQSHNEGLMSEMEDLQRRLVMVRGGVAAVLKNNNPIFKRCLEQFGTPSPKTSVSKKWNDTITKAIEDLRNDGPTQHEWEELVNAHLDNVMKRFREDFPSASKWDAQILLYHILGFDAGIQATILKVAVSTYYNKKSALKRRIAESSSPNKDEYAGLLQ